MDRLGVTAPLARLKGKRALVIGDTGFKGSWLSQWLHLLGADVVGYSLPARGREAHFTRLGLGKTIHHVDGDVRDLAALTKLCRKFQPQVVFHLAAQALTRLAYAEPKLTFDVNVGGSVNVLEALRHTPSVRSVVYVTSDKCYRNKEWAYGYRENDELGGGDPYSASKAAAEMVLAAYVDSFFRARQTLGIASARAGNVIGGGDWSADRIVPDCIRALRGHRPITLRHPAATRPWQHVLDLLFGYLLLAVRLYEQPLAFRGAWNFGPRPEATHTVKALADRIVAHWGKGSVRIKTDPHAPHEASLLFLNCDKARRALGWRTRWEFERAIAETVHWYRQVIDGTPARTVTVEQIRAYQESP
jgi:CDP-glucose 4,6-dehydratase